VGKLPGIRKCSEVDFETICSIINEAAITYKGVIPADCWKEPYMARTELEHETREGVRFRDTKRTEDSSV